MTGCYHKHMKLGVQGWYLTQPYTGIGVHTRGLLSELAKHKKVKQLIVPVPAKVKAIKGVKTQLLKPKAWLLHAGLKKWYWERVQAPSFFAQQNPDWEYYPYPCPLPRVSPNRRAMTVHDTILWTDPRYRGNKLKSRYHEAARRALVHVDQIFTVSESSKKDLGIPAAKVLYNGLPEVPKKLPKSPHPGALVYLGGYDIRKNVNGLIQAYQKLQTDKPLILIGEPHHSSPYYPELQECPGLIKAGKLSDKKVYALLKEAFAFVHLSDAEGFNLPLLQAMAMGTPAVVADIPVNREVSANSALFVPLSPHADLTATIKTLSSPKRRAALIKKQKARAKDFSWRNTANIFIRTLA